MMSLLAILRHRYETDEHFKVSKSVLLAIRAQAIKEATQEADLSFGGGMGRLWGIPFVPDLGLPPGHWRLVDNSTGEVIYEGVIEENSNGDH